MKDYSSNWGLDSSFIFMNHGSFGACPVEVLKKQMQFRDRLENEPVRFILRELPGMIFDALERLAVFLGVEATDIVFVPNVTHGVNAVLRSIDLSPGDEILTTNHEYFSCKNTVDLIAERSGARVVVADIPFPLESDDQVIEAILNKASARTRIALIYHITSPTALIFPVKRIVDELDSMGIDVLVDGAHAPGMIPLDIDDLGAHYYTGNFHKWLCSPKGAGFLYVRKDKQQSIKPVVVSHVKSDFDTYLSSFQVEFYWTGTDDPTSYLCVPEAIEFLQGLCPDGLPGIMTRNHKLALGARKVIMEALDLDPPCPDHMIGSMAALPLPDCDVKGPVPPDYFDPLQDKLFNEYNIEVPVIPWREMPGRVIRISAFLYNNIEQYEYLADILKRYFK